MAKKAEEAEIKALVEAMVEALTFQRGQGGDAYPPTLWRLAELTGKAPPEDRIISAAMKQPFTQKAVVLEKVGRTPSLNSPVYFKDDAPPTPRKAGPKRAATRKPKVDAAAQLAEQMLAVLPSQQRLGPEAYPPSLRRLAELCGVNSSEPVVTKAAGHKTVANKLVVSAKVNSKPALDAPVFLREDLEQRFPAMLPALIVFALKCGSVTGKTDAFTLAELKKRFVVPLQKPFGEALERGVEGQNLPLDVLWVLQKGKPLFFLRESLRPGRLRKLQPDPEATRVSDRPESLIPSDQPPHDFGAAFHVAFAELDRHNGGNNFVKLAELRRALSGFSRHEFDAGLRVLRLAGQFTLNSHEGLHGSLTPEEREAGVREAGSLLIYASRR